MMMIKNTRQLTSLIIGSLLLLLSFYHSSLANSLTFRAEVNDGSLDELRDSRDNKLPTQSSHVLSGQSVTSGARSSYQLAPFGDSLNLFNLFNVFRGSESQLIDERGNFIAFDKSGIANNEKVSYETHSFHSQTPSSQLDYNDLAQILIEKLNFNREKAPVKSSKSPTGPVLVIPGYGGSRLEARLDKPTVSRYFCDHKSDWFDIWVNVKLLLPYMIDCLIDNMRLEYDEITNTTRNTAGVEIRVKNSTQISSVAYLHDLPISGFAYFAPIIDQLVESSGYIAEENIRGAPYDFRKAPDELQSYFQQVRETSEQMYKDNNNKPVTYICHSMGCNNMLYFFQRQPKAWKDTHVKRLISIAAPWGGSISAMRAAALGDNLGMPYLFSESKLIHVQRSLPSTMYLFPHQTAFGDVPLITSNVGKRYHYEEINSTNDTASESSSSDRKYYMANDFKQFFDDIDHPDGYKMWLNTKDLLGSLEAPQVELWCIVGRGLKTLGRLEYMGEFPHSTSQELYDDGDGTVNLQSGNFCLKWIEQQDKPVYYKEFNSGHMEILKDAQVVNFINRIVMDEIHDSTK